MQESGSTAYSWERADPFDSHGDAPGGHDRNDWNYAPAVAWLVHNSFLCFIRDANGRIMPLIGTSKNGYSYPIDALLYHKRPPVSSKIWIIVPFAPFFRIFCRNSVFPLWQFLHSYVQVAPENPPYFVCTIVQRLPLDRGKSTMI